MSNPLLAINTYKPSHYNYSQSELDDLFRDFVIHIQQ